MRHFQASPYTGYSTVVAGFGNLHKALLCCMEENESCQPVSQIEPWVRVRAMQTFAKWAERKRGEKRFLSHFLLFFSLAAKAIFGHSGLRAYPRCIALSLFSLFFFGRLKKGSNKSEKDIEILFRVLAIINSNTITDQIMLGI